MFTPGQNVGLAEWIIHSFRLSELYLTFSFSTSHSQINVFLASELWAINHRNKLISPGCVFEYVRQAQAREVDANKRTVTKYIHRTGHNMSSCLFSFSYIGHILA